LEQALQQLKHVDQEMLIMSRYQGLTYKDIGNIMGYTEGAVKARIFRALKELKKHYLKLDVEK
jgi:RNA polymerase sigma-70 factor (ECF subfamily)